MRKLLLCLLVIPFQVQSMSYLLSGLKATIETEARNDPRVINYADGIALEQMAKIALNQNNDQRIMMVAKAFRGKLAQQVGLKEGEKLTDKKIDQFSTMEKEQLMAILVKIPVELMDSTLTDFFYMMCDDAVKMTDLLKKSDDFSDKKDHIVLQKIDDTMLYTTEEDTEHDQQHHKKKKHKKKKHHIALEEKK